LTLYTKFDFETEVGGFAITGNVGAQYVQTDQSSTGYIGIVGENFKVCDANDDGVIDASCEQDVSDDYSHFLPSLNVSLEVSDNQFVRFAATKTISRARIDQMKASGFVKFDQNENLIAIPNTLEAVDTYGSPWSKFQGNPTLRPLEANNFDLSFENYFDDEGYVSVALFYKDLVNWTRDGNQTIDFTNDVTNDGANYFIDGFHTRVITSEDGLTGPDGTEYPQGTKITPPDFGKFSFFEDGLTGKVKGAEVTANIPMGMLVNQLEGFGIAASATFIDAELSDGTSIPGQSDEVLSFTAYYEKNGFEVRLSATDRSEFLTYQRGGSNKIETATRAAITVVDAQISYDFEDSGIEYLEGLRVSLQGTNLTDEKEETIDSNGIVTLRREFGPSYMLNFNYSFY